MSSNTPAVEAPKLVRTLGLWDLVLYGMIVIEPTAPMPVYGIMTQRAHGHAVLTVLIAMVAMLFTATSYGRMARAYPSAGSAFTYVGREIHPLLGYITGWCMAMDYIFSPTVCTILCSKFAMNFAPQIPYWVWVLGFVLLFTRLNVSGIRTSARINYTLMVGMGIVIVIFLIVVVRYVLHSPHDGFAFFSRPFYDPQTFSTSAVLGGTSLAVLTYMGFDGISTLSEEAENPRRNILLATVLACLITGVLATIEVYAAQLVWPGSKFPDVDTAYVHVAGRAGGPWLFAVINVTLLVATLGAGMASQLGAARLLYGMGRGNAIPKSFFGAIDPKRRIPRNSVVFVGVLAFAGANLLSFERAAELQNFGALLAFMGVNAAAFVRYYVREAKKTWSALYVPAAGFVVCLLIWLSLSRPAKVVGAIWMVAGIAYGALKTHGFKAALVTFEVPKDTE
jgi:putrescine importer